MQQYLPWFIATAALAVLATLAVLWLLQALRRPAGPPPLPVEWDLLPRPVFTADERRVYRQLRDALPHHIVLAKLPLVRFCQPADPKAVRYWFDLLGANHVTFAVCSANGRVLAAIDLSYDRGGPPGRSTRIKQAVLAACRVRYLRCPADHLPSIPELQLLVPLGSNASRGPQPAQGAASMAGAAPGMGGMASAGRRRERSTLWQDSMSFHDSFFSSGSRRELDSGHGDLRDMHGRVESDLAPAGMVADDPAPPQQPFRH
jgi:hypothetical protein